MYICIHTHVYVYTHVYMYMHIHVFIYVTIQRLCVGLSLYNSLYHIIYIHMCLPSINRDTIFLDLKIDFLFTHRAIWPAPIPCAAVLCGIKQWERNVTACWGCTGGDAFTKPGACVGQLASNHSPPSGDRVKETFVLGYRQILSKEEWGKWREGV